MENTKPDRFHHFVIAAKNEISKKGSDDLYKNRRCEKCPQETDHAGIRIKIHRIMNQISLPYPDFPSKHKQYACSHGRNAKPPYLYQHRQDCLPKRIEYRCCIDNR